MVQAWHDRCEVDLSTGITITDDLNPVDLWSEAVNLEDYRFMRKEFGFKGLIW